MSKRLLICMLGVLMLGGLLPGVGWAGLTYDGSTTIGENIMPEAVKAFEAKTGIKFDKVGGLGSGKGFKALMAGEVVLAGVSRALEAEEKKLKPYYQTIGYDAVAIYVNEKNPVKALSKDQLKGIFTAKITNWKEVGGKDAGIVLVTEIKTGGRATIKEFKHMALDNAEIAASKEIDKPHDCVRDVAENENAVTFASLAFKEPGTKVLGINKVEPTNKNVKSGTYILSRPLVLVAKALPKDDLKKFFDFILSAEGQAIVAKNFVPVK